MQTFLPKISFEKSAKILDYRRLNKQKLECVTIHRIITGNGIIKDGRYPGYSFHPATIMWLGYHDCLAYYFNSMVIEWKNRGYVNNMSLMKHKHSFDFPPFIGLRKFHSAHRAKLLGKNYGFYSKYGWSEMPMSIVDPYYWPSIIDNKTKIVTHIDGGQFELVFKNG